MCEKEKTSSDNLWRIIRNPSFTRHLIIRSESDANGGLPAPPRPVGSDNRIIRRIIRPVQCSAGKLLIKG